MQLFRVVHELFVKLLAGTHAQAVVHRHGLEKTRMRKLRLEGGEPDLTDWTNMVECNKGSAERVTIATGTTAP